MGAEAIIKKKHNLLENRQAKFKKHFRDILNNDQRSVSLQNASDKIREAFTTGFKGHYQNKQVLEMKEELNGKAHHFNHRRVYDRLDTFYLGLGGVPREDERLKEEENFRLKS